MPIWRAFREDLRGCPKQVAQLRSGLLAAGYRLSNVRVLEILIWLEAEARGCDREAEEKGLA